MIKPINNHVLIEPLKHESFVSSQRDSFEEIGIVVDYDASFNNIINDGYFEGVPINPRKISKIKKGHKVYFDSWLAVKYPKGNDGDFFWLVKFEDIRAIDDGKE